MADFDQVIQLKPDSAEALRHRAFINQKRRNFDKSIADYSRAIQLDPKDAEALRGRGLAELSLHNNDAAITDLTAAIGQNPKDALQDTARWPIPPRTTAADADDREAAGWN